MRILVSLIWFAVTLPLWGCGGQTDCRELRSCARPSSDAGSDGAADAANDAPNDANSDASDAAADVGADVSDGPSGMDATDGSDAMPDAGPLVRSFAVGYAAEVRLSDLCCTALNGAVRFVNTGDVPLDMNTLEAEAALVNPPSGATAMMIPRPDTLLLPPGSAAGLLAESAAVLLESQVPEPVIDDTHNYFDLVINGLPPDGPFDFDVNVTVRVDGVDANLTVRVRYQQNVHAYTLGRRIDSEVVVVE